MRSCRRWAGRPRSTPRSDLAPQGVLEKYGVEMIGASRDAIDKAEDRELFKHAMRGSGSRPAQSADRALAGGGAARSPRRSVTRSSSARPSRSAARGGGIAYNREELEAIVRARRWMPRPTGGGAHRGVRARLERIRAGGDARSQGQLHHRLLDRELRPDGRPHRRLDHGRPGADAHRQGVPAHARRLDRRAARDRRRDRRLERAVRGQSQGRARCSSSR